MSAPPDENTTRSFDEPGAGATETPGAAHATHSFHESGAAVPDERAIASKIGRFEIRRFLGEGAFGAVYEAYDPQLDRAVAIKVAKLDRGDSEQRIKRFLREAKSAAGLRHPHIVPVYEFGQEGDHFYIVSAFIQGRTLQADRAERKSKDEPLDISRAARLVQQLAEALAYAHSQGIVHRDVKPANVMIDDKDQPMLMDFGLATRQDEAEKLTHAGAVLGTPLYMSPEQARGQGADAVPASDQYSLGVMLFEMIAGRPPFVGAPELVMFHHTETEPASPRSYHRAISRDLETICLKCLQKSPAGRYASATELANDLRRFLEGEAITARSVGVFEKGWRWCRRNPALAGLLSFSALAVVAILIGTFWFTSAIADEQHKKELAESDRKAEAARREAAEKLERANKYFAVATQARERIAARDHGWSWDAIELLSEASALETEAKNPVDLRTSLVSCLHGIDMRKRKSLAPGFYARTLCYHPNGKWLFLGEGRVGTGFAMIASLHVLVVDVGTGVTVQKLPFPSRLAGTLTDPRPDMANTIAISPNGRWLAVGTRAGSLHLWDLEAKELAPATWQAETVPFGKTAECVDVAFSLDNSALFAAVRLGIDGAISRWNVADRKRTARRTTAEASGGLVVCPSGKRIYVNDQNNCVLQLDSQDLNDRAGGFGHQDSSVQAITPDGKGLLTSNRRRLIHWDLASRKQAFVYRETNKEFAFRDDVQSLKISPDGRILVALDEPNQQLSFFDLTTRERSLPWQTQLGAFAVAFDPDSRNVAVSGREETVILEIARHDEFRVIGAHPHAIMAVSVSQDGSRIAGIGSDSISGAGPGLPMYWRVQKKNSVAPDWTGDRFGGNLALADTAFDITGNRLAYAVSGEVRVFDLSQENRIIVTQPRPGLRRCRFAPDGSLWMIGDDLVYCMPTPLEKNKIHTWNNPFEAKFSGLAAMRSLAVGRNVVAAGGLDGRLRLFSTSMSRSGGLNPLKSILVESRTTLGAAALNADDSIVVVGSFSGKCHLIGVVDSVTRASWDAHRQEVTCAAWLAGNAFVTGSRDGLVKHWIWNGTTVRELWSMRMNSGVTSLSTSTDGRKLGICCEGNRGVALWDLGALNSRFQKMKIAIGS